MGGMGSDDFSYILAKSTSGRSCRFDDFALYHEHYRGFGTTPHHHEDLEIIVPLGGRMHFFTEKEDHLIGPEWACLILPETRHGFNCLDGEQTFLALFAPKGWLNHLNEGIAGHELPSRGAFVKRDVGLWLQGQQIASELHSAQVGQHSSLSMGMKQLGIYFLRSLTNSESVTPPPESRVLRAIDAILKRYSEPLTVEVLAQELAMSPRNFERHFRQATGSSPRQFLIEARVGAGKEMLRTTKESVMEIALATGFKNPSHFSETFQRLTGLTPSAFRAEHHSQQARFVQ